MSLSKAIGVNKKYRPNVGDTLFATVVTNSPILMTVKGYHHDERFSSEQIEYTNNHGDKRSTSLNNLVFYPDAPIDSQFLYIVCAEENEFMERSEITTVGYFFDPKSAFSFIEDILSKNVKVNYKPSAQFSDYQVYVEKI